VAANTNIYLKSQMPIDVNHQPDNLCLLFCKL